MVRLETSSLASQGCASLVGGSLTAQSMAGKVAAIERAGIRYGSARPHQKVVCGLSQLHVMAEPGKVLDTHLGQSEFHELLVYAQSQDPPECRPAPELLQQTGSSNRLYGIEAARPLGAWTL
jgi:hypothetical protein